jgi:hypothetical protein
VHIEKVQVIHEVVVVVMRPACTLNMVKIIDRCGPRYEVIVRIVIPVLHVLERIIRLNIMLASALGGRWLCEEDGVDGGGGSWSGSGESDGFFEQIVQGTAKEGGSSLESPLVVGRERLVSGGEVRHLSSGHAVVVKATIDWVWALVPSTML